MRQELQRADRHAVGPVAEEGVLARLRPVAERRRDASAERCGVSTAFRWRHRFLTAPAASPILTGIVEADDPKGSAAKPSCGSAIRAPGPGNARNRACPETKRRIARPAGQHFSI